MSRENERTIPESEAAAWKQEQVAKIKAALAALVPGIEFRDKAPAAFEEALSETAITIGIPLSLSSWNRKEPRIAYPEQAKIEIRVPYKDIGGDWKQVAPGRTFSIRSFDKAVAYVVEIRNRTAAKMEAAQVRKSGGSAAREATIADLDALFGASEVQFYVGNVNERTGGFPVRMGLQGVGALSFDVDGATGVPICKSATFAPAVDGVRPLLQALKTFVDKAVGLDDGEALDE